MGAFGILPQTLLVFLLMMLPGVILGKCGILQAEGMPSLNGILLYVAMPMLVLANLLETDFTALHPIRIITTAATATGLSLLLTLAGLLLLRRLFPATWRADTFCAVFSNCGFMGIPLATLAFPDEPEIAAFVSLYNVCSCFLIWTLGVLILTGERQKMRLSKALCNPVVIAFAVGVILSATGAGKHLGVLSETATLLAELTTPLSMTVLGFEMTKKESLTAALRPATLAVCFLKLLAAPLLVLGLIALTRQWGGMGRPLEIALLISAGVSTAATAPAMAENYGNDSAAAAGRTVATTLLMAATFPLIYALYGII